MVNVATSRGTAHAAGLDLAAAIGTDAEDPLAPGPTPEAPLVVAGETETAEGAILPEGVTAEITAKEKERGIERREAGPPRPARAEAALAATARAAMALALPLDLSPDLIAAASPSRLEM